MLHLVNTFYHLQAAAAAATYVAHANSHSMAWHGMAWVLSTSGLFRRFVIKACCASAQLYKVCYTVVLQQGSYMLLLTNRLVRVDINQSINRINCLINLHRRILSVNIRIVEDLHLESCSSWFAPSGFQAPWQCLSSPLAV